MNQKFKIAEQAAARDAHFIRAPEPSRYLGK
jgi:hypothetical protein